MGDNKIEIKHRINQTRKAINALNSVWWHKNITKNRKLYIYQTIIQSILVYGAEVWQIPTREINNILSTEMGVLRSAKKSRMERTKNERVKEIIGVKGKPDIIDINTFEILKTKTNIFYRFVREVDILRFVR